MSQPTFASSVPSEFPNDPYIYLEDESKAFTILDSIGDYHKRLLKEFFESLGHGAGAYNLIRAIIGHPDRVEELAEYLKTNILISGGSSYKLCYRLLTGVAVRAAAGRTPAVKSTPVTEHESHVEKLIMTMHSSTRNDQKCLKERTLIRDGGNCVISGMPDPTYHPGAVGLRTECARIFPFSIGLFNGKSSKGVTQISVPEQRIHMLNFPQVSKAAEIFAAIHFVFPELCNFDSENMNDDCNAFTLGMNVHQDFDELRIALLPTVGRQPCS